MTPNKQPNEEGTYIYDGYEYHKVEEEPKGECDHRHFSPVCNNLTCGVNLLSRAREEERKEIVGKIHKEINEIIEKSKATFFVNEKNKDVKIPEDELLYELKAEISNNVGMYFVKLLESQGEKK